MESGGICEGHMAGAVTVFAWVSPPRDLAEPPFALPQWRFLLAPSFSSSIAIAATEW